MVLRTAPCLSALPFWNRASTLVVVTLMLWDCANRVNSSELYSVPGSTSISCGAPAQLSHIWIRYWISAFEDWSGALHAVWKLVAQSTTWYMWYSWLFLLVQVEPSEHTRPLKSSSSLIALGLAIFGWTWDRHMEHWRSKAACAILNMVLSLSGLGWPRFLCARRIICCSSLDSLLKRSDCFGFCMSCSWEGVKTAR